MSDSLKSLVDSLTISLAGCTKQDMGQRIGAQIHRLGSILSVYALTCEDQEDAKAIEGASNVLFWFSTKVTKHEFSHMHAAIIAVCINAVNTIQQAQKMDEIDSEAKWKAELARNPL